MLVKKYKSKLIALSNPFKDIYTLEFKSLSRYKYYPGQFLHIALDPDYDGSGQWPESRCFSMQSSPDDESVKITYAVKGRFTKQMEEQLHVGSEIWLKLPYGDLFTKDHNKVNTVFIAGGTGITPFLSLFKHSSFTEYSNPRIYLGFRSESYNIYLKELISVKLCDPKFYYEDIDGLLDIDKIFSENGINNDYFISGPPVMIKFFKEKLITQGVPGIQILTDDWE
jgi:propane monooxygenase reductase subunit